MTVKPPYTKVGGGERKQTEHSNKMGFKVPNALLENAMTCFTKGGMFSKAFSRINGSQCKTLDRSGSCRMAHGGAIAIMANVCVLETCSVPIEGRGMFNHSRGFL